MPFLKVDAERLGWLQIAIISYCWNREMYGLEIQKHLKLEGHIVGSGQLYPALKKLQEMGAIEGREQTRVGATRIFYKTTTAGQKMIVDYVASILRIFNQIFLEKTAFAAEKLLELVSITPGMIVADLSLEDIEQILVKIVPNVGNTGRYFLMCPSKELEEISIERIAHFGLRDYVKIFDRTAKRMPLADHSCDLVLCIFTLHEINQDWVIPEMIRLLKPNGKGVILDVIEIKDHFFIEMLASLIKRAEFGINPELIRDQLKKAKMTILNESKLHGVQYFIFQP